MKNSAAADFDDGLRFSSVSYYNAPEEGRRTARANTPKGPVFDRPGLFGTPGLTLRSRSGPPFGLSLRAFYASRSQGMMSLTRHDSRAICDMEVATNRPASATEIRKADRSRSSGPPRQAHTRTCERLDRRRS
jgi:hypothetical protein